MEQMSEEWFEEKRGILSASDAELYLVSGKNKMKIGAGLQTLADKKVSEILAVYHDYSDVQTAGKSAQWGIENEPFARAEFERRNLAKVSEVGFIRCVDHYIGISPDGIVENEECGTEIKCYDSLNHLNVVMNGVVPKKVIAQCQFSMMVTGYKKWYAVFYDPRVVEELQYRQFEILRDEDMIKIFISKAVHLSNYIKEKTNKYVGI